MCRKNILSSKSLCLGPNYQRWSDLVSRGRNTGFWILRGGQTVGLSGSKPNLVTEPNPASNVVLLVQETMADMDQWCIVLFRSESVFSLSDFMFRLTVCSHPVLGSQTSPDPLGPPVHLLLDSLSSLFLLPQSLKLIWHLENRCCNEAVVAKMICTCVCTLELFPPLSPCFTVFYCLYMDVTVRVHTTSIKLTSQ